MNARAKLPQQVHERNAEASFASDKNQELPA